MRGSEEVAGTGPGRLPEGHGDERLGAAPEARAFFGVEPETWYRRTPRCETFPWPDGRPSVVVKRFPPADPAGLFRRAARAPAKQEFEALRDLELAGFPVPKALGCAVDAARGSVLVMGLVPHSETLRQRLAREPDSPLGAELAELVAGFHSAGWYHRDLYLEHVAVRAAGAEEELVLLDLGRARRRRAPRSRWFVKDLAALLHSAPPAIDGAQRRAFLERYLTARGIAAASLPKWSARITAHAHRMASHVPRHVDTGSREGGVGAPPPLGGGAPDPRR